MPIPDRYVLLSDDKAEVESLRNLSDEIERIESDFMPGPENVLSEEQAEYFDKALWAKREPRRAALYVCLHMGLTQTEVNLLRYGDFDFNTKNVLVSYNGDMDNTRTVPIPSHVERYLRSIEDCYPTPECYLVSGLPYEAPPLYIINTALRAVNAKYKISEHLSAVTLRNTFVKRLLDCGVGIATISELTGIKPLDKFVKRFGSLLEANTGDIERLSKYIPDRKPDFYPITESGKRMNLLILGAGSQGPVVKEIAEAVGMFDKIAFLDDDPDNKLAMDTCENFAMYVEQYPIAIPSFGDCGLRGKWAALLEEKGFILPKIIHPSATVSNQVSIAECVVIEAKAIIGNGVTIKRGCIISAGAVLDKGCTIRANTHIGCACTITKNSVVPEGVRIPAGTTFGMDM